MPTFDARADGILSRMSGFDGACDRVLGEFQVAVDEAEQYRKQQQQDKEREAADSAWVEFGEQRATDNADMFADMNVTSEADAVTGTEVQVDDNPWGPLVPVDDAAVVSSLLGDEDKAVEMK